MTNKIIKLIKKEKPKSKEWKLTTWYSHSITNDHITSADPSNFPLKWGDIGIIPNNLKNRFSKLKIKNTKTLLKNIIETIHKYIAAKWRLKFFALYNKNLDITEICNLTFIK